MVQRVGLDVFKLRELQQCQPVSQVSARRERQRTFSSKKRPSISTHPRNSSTHSLLPSTRSTSFRRSISCDSRLARSRMLFSSVCSFCDLVMLRSASDFANRDCVGVMVGSGRADGTVLCQRTRQKQPKQRGKCVLGVGR